MVRSRLKDDTGAIARAAEAGRLLAEQAKKKARPDLCAGECVPGCGCEKMPVSRMLDTITDPTAKKILVHLGKSLFFVLNSG